LLPDYYLPKRLAGGHFATAAYGNLFSPARGLFVYSPFLLLPLMVVRHTWRVVLQEKGLLVLLAWPVLHWISISKFPHWWGGWSYGPRLMSDVLPAFYVLIVFLFTVRLARPRLIGVTLTVLCGLAFFINTVQGLYNPYTARWNSTPNVCATSHRLFDWSDPQFLQTREKYWARFTQIELESLSEAIQLKERASFRSNNVVFASWSVAEPEHRWSLGKTADIVFRLEGQTPVEGELTMNVGTLGQQRVLIELNDRKIFEQRLNGWHRTLAVRFDASAVSLSGPNRIRFRLPDAARPGRDDPRVLGLAMRWFMIE